MANRCGRPAGVDGWCKAGAFATLNQARQDAGWPDLCRRDPTPGGFCLTGGRVTCISWGNFAVKDRVNQVQIDGMQSRAAGAPRSSNPHASATTARRDWESGWERMEQHIGRVLENARDILKELAHIRDRRRQRGE